VRDFPEFILFFKIKKTASFRKYIQAISIHGRTRKQMYKGEADWTLIGKIKENPRIHIPVFGNGDMDSPQKVAEYKSRYGVDGIMIGRASIGYPWVFRETAHYLKTGELMDPPGISERVACVKQHLTKSIEWKGERLGVLEMRRHYSNYFRNYRNIKAFRLALVKEDNPNLIFALLENIEQYFSSEIPVPEKI